MLMEPIILVFIKLMGAVISSHWDLRDTGTSRDCDTLALSLGWLSESGPGSHNNVTFSPVGHGWCRDQDSSITPGFTDQHQWTSDGSPICDQCHRPGRVRRQCRALKQRRAGPQPRIPNVTFARRVPGTKGQERVPNQRTRGGSRIFERGGGAS